MHMKRNIWIALGLLMTINSHALVVSVEGQGDIPEEGMELTLTEAEEDILSGEMVMKLNGSLRCNGPLTVRISRSAEGITDEFCCANQCTGGNEERTEILNFNPGGMASWFIHYNPTSDSDETIVYTFTEGQESRTLTVHYKYPAEGIRNTDPCADGVRKILKDGVVYIIKNNKTYTIL